MLKGRSTIALLLVLAISYSTYSSTSVRGQENLTEISILQNGGFELGLSGWGVVDSGIGESKISNSVYRSGASSLTLDMVPTTAIPKGDVQGVVQTVKVANARGIQIEAWYLTPACSFPDGTAGQLNVKVGQLSVHYPIDGTCGRWKNVTRNVKDDLQSTYGPNGLALFQQNGRVNITFALELLHTNILPLYDYSSVNWDDVKVIAQVPTQSEVQSVTSSSVTTKLTSTTTEFAPQVNTTTAITTTVRTTPTTTTENVSPLIALKTVSLLPEFSSVLPWPSDQLLLAVLMTLLLLGIISVSSVWLLEVRNRKRQAGKSSSDLGRCPNCNARIRYSDSKFCVKCGTKLASDAR